MNRKYQTLTELAEAFKSGDLNKDHYVLTLDNDCSSLMYIGPADGQSDQDRLDDEAREMFRGNGYADLQEACEAAGIPCEWV